MAITRRQLIATGGLTTGGALAALAIPAAAGTAASKDAISVKDPAFGSPAAGDGTTDDTGAIQDHIIAADGTGHTVFFPVGTYLISSTIVVPPGVSLVGEGDALGGVSANWNSGVPGTATLLGAIGFNGPSLITWPTPQGDPDEVAQFPVRACVISNLRFAGHTASTSAGVVFYGSMIRVEHCNFWRFAPDIVQWKAKPGWFVGNMIRGHRAGSNQVGLRIQAADSYFLGNDITSEGDNVFVESYADGVLFQHNICYNSILGAGIHWKGDRGIIANNRVDENALAGILVVGTGTAGRTGSGWGNVVSGNCLVLNGVNSSKPAQERAGIRLHNTWATAVTGNTCSNWNHGSLTDTQHYGVALTGDSNCRNNTITGNTFAYHTSGGMYTAPGLDAINVISGNATEA